MLRKIIEAGGGYAEFAREREYEAERIRRFEERIASLMAEGVGLGTRVPLPVRDGWERGTLEVKKIPRKVTEHPLNPRPVREALQPVPGLEEYLDKSLPSSQLDLILGQVTGTYYFNEHLENMLSDRLFTARALRALIQKIYDDFAPGDAKLVVEMGCGPALLLYELAPERLKHNWHAFDSDRTNVEHATIKVRRLELAAQVHQLAAEMAFLLPALKSSDGADLWVGLSSYDSPLDLAAAIGAIKVKPGGQFIHIQDVNPVIQAAHTFGQKFPDRKRTWLVRGAVPEPTEESLAQFLDKRRGDIFFEHGGHLMDPREELHDRMLYLLQQRGFRILDEGTYHSIYIGEREPSHEDFPVIPEGRKQANAFVRLPAGASYSYHPHVPQFHRELNLPFPVESAFLEMTVAEVIVAEKI